MKNEHIKPIEEALEKVQNRFLLTVVAARRWEHLTAGAPAMVPARPGDHPLDTVLEEINADRLQLNDEEFLIEPVGEPEREVSDEPLFTEAFDPDQKSASDILGSDE